MLSKTKQFSLSMKLTLLYAVMLLGILLFTSLLTFSSLYHAIYTQVQSDISISSKNLADYLVEKRPVNQDILKEQLLLHDVILKIRDNQNNLVVDSAPYLADSPELLKDETPKLLKLILLLKSSHIHVAHSNNTYYYYTAYDVQQGGHTYRFELMKSLAEHTHFLQTLIKILVLTNLVGLLIAFLSGILISNRILRPLRNIIAAAREIKVDDLAKRIHVNNTGDELHELAETFNHMLTRLQTGFEQQRRFVADASHELKTPITVISGYTDILDRWGKNDQEALEEGLAAIKSEVGNMDDLTDKLLFLARADQGKQLYHKTCLPIASLMETIFQETRMIAPNHNIILEQNDSVTINADSAAIKQILRIFTENSIKYTPPGGTIRLAARKIGQQLEISVADTGIGIPTEEQPKIFDRFYRVDRSRSKSTGGSGLGLSIAHWIAQEHGGSIRLDSTLAQGTTITLELPI